MHGGCLFIHDLIRRKYDGLGRADITPRTKLGVSSHEDYDGFFRKFDFPAFSEDTENAEGAAGTEPAFCYFFEMLDAVDDVSLCVLFW